MKRFVIEWLRVSQYMLEQVELHVEWWWPG